LVGAANKVAPKGDKRAYSEVAYAELQKVDSQQSVSPLTLPASAVTPPPKASEKPSENSPPVESDSVDWMWPVESKPSALFDEGKIKDSIF
jgi:lipoprotein NlpD